jgi:F-type H+-transporting ATPase subunit b
MKARHSAFFVFILFLAVRAYASTSGDHHDEVPVKTIIYQLINVTILFSGLFYYLKNPIKQMFKEKKETFVAFAEKAKQARVAAEQEHMDIQVRLTKLESTAEESILRAKAEAADMKQQLIAEANEVSRRIRQDSEAAVRLEIEKAKVTLREKMIRQATQMARNQMDSKVSQEDHKRLQGDFIESIKAVQP